MCDCITASTLLSTEVKIPSSVKVGTASPVSSVGATTIRKAWHWVLCTYASEAGKRVALGKG